MWEYLHAGGQLQEAFPGRSREDSSELSHASMCNGLECGIHSSMFDAHAQ